MSWQLDVENCAGIRGGRVRFEPGVNVVRGSNWRGKSSLVAAVAGAMGCGTPLTEDADRGAVVLRTDDGTTEVTFERDGHDVVRRGDPFLDEERDRIAADLFAFLDEDNEVRRAVRRGEPLDEVLTRPLDYENLEARIADLVEERERVAAALERATEAAAELPEVEAEIASLEDRLEELEATRASSVEDDAGDGGAGATREELSEARAERKGLRSLIDQLERTIERTETRLDERYGELESLEVPAAEDVEAELAAARERHDELQRDAELLQAVHAANRRVLEADRLDLLATVERDLAGDRVDCWVCGGEAEREAFESRLEALGERVMSARRRADEHAEDIEALEGRLEEITRLRRRREDLEDEIAELNGTLADREESLASARERLEEVEAHVEALETDVEDLDDRRAELDAEIKYVEASLDDVRDERDTLVARADHRESLEDELDALDDEVARLRDRKATVERDLREAFDDAMADILQRFDLGFEAARLTGGFELVVARNGHEASLDAMSEGELELLGIATALAGHEAFEVGDAVPVILLDGLGSLSDENLRSLVAYLEGRAERLVVTAYPEHGAFGDHTIDPGAWDVVSRSARADTSS